MTRHSSLSILLLALWGCGPAGDVGSLDLQFGLVSSQTQRAARLDAVDADGGAITVDEASIHLERIDFELPAGEKCDPSVLEAPVVCDDDTDGEATVRIEGPILIDLATGTSKPSLEGLTIPAGVYKRIDLRLSTDDALDGASFVASGIFDDGGAAVPWALSLGIDEDARFEAVGGLEVKDATTALVVLDIALWFADLPVSTCYEDGMLADDGAGGVWLDDTKGCDIEDLLEDAIKESGQVHDDHDDNPKGTDD